jgi:predicted aspartyl protease
MTTATMQEKNELDAFLTQKGYVAIPIRENISGHLLIEVMVNGQPGLFILDTGAGGTVIDSSKAGELNLVLQEEDIHFTGAGAGGQGLEVCPSEGNRIEIGNFLIPDFTLSVMSLEHVSQSLIQIGAHEEVMGVIGVDVLKPARAIIDYSQMMLYLMNTDTFETIS